MTGSKCAASNAYRNGSHSPRSAHWTRFCVALSVLGMPMEEWPGAPCAVDARRTVGVGRRDNARHPPHRERRASIPTAHPGMRPARSAPPARRRAVRRKRSRGYFSLGWAYLCERCQLAVPSAQLMVAVSAVAFSGAARVVTMFYPAAMNDDRVNDRIDEAVLALLYQGIFEHHPVMGPRSWKAFDWAAMGRLHDKGLISDPASKARSVLLTETSLGEAEVAFRRLFEADDLAAGSSGAIVAVSPDASRR